MGINEPELSIVKIDCSCIRACSELVGEKVYTDETERISASFFGGKTEVLFDGRMVAFPDGCCKVVRKLSSTKM